MQLAMSMGHVNRYAADVPGCHGEGSVTVIQALAVIAEIGTVFIRRIEQKLQVPQSSDTRNRSLLRETPTVPVTPGNGNVPSRRQVQLADKRPEPGSTRKTANRDKDTVGIKNIFVYGTDILRQEILPGCILPVVTVFQPHPGTQLPAINPARDQKKTGSSDPQNPDKRQTVHYELFNKPFIIYFRPEPTEKSIFQAIARFANICGKAEKQLSGLLNRPRRKNFPSIMRNKMFIK
jgi:hypothetical protein